jgi:DNA modification methylase
MTSCRVICGNALTELPRLPAASVHCCVTSPPYWGLRNYRSPPVDWPAGQYIPMAGIPAVSYPAWNGQLGLEPDPIMYVGHLVLIFREVHRVLRKDGTLWLNLGDNSVGSGKGGNPGISPDIKQNRNRGSLSMRGVLRDVVGLRGKNLVCQPWRVGFALQADGWIFRQRNHWLKSNPMPESTGDRTTNAHEYVLHFAKSRFYYYDNIAIAEPVTGNAHERGNGVNAKCAGWDDGPGSHRAVDHATESDQGPKFRRVDRGGGNSRFNISRDVEHENRAVRSRQNPSFSAAVTKLVKERNCRNYWIFPTEPYKGPHFATFPKELCRRPILAGTSEKGCCPKCGAPWKRVIQKTSVDREGFEGAGKNDGAESEVAGHRIVSAVRAARANGGDHDNPFPPKVTLGWAATCPCPEGPPVPCVVLDPFGGSGTVGEVAQLYGRNAIVIDVNPKYLPLIYERTGQSGIHYV